jgi:hypothetical protein
MDLAAGSEGPGVAWGKGKECVIPGFDAPPTGSVDGQGCRLATAEDGEASLASWPTNKRHRRGTACRPEPWNARFRRTGKEGREAT